MTRSRPADRRNPRQPRAPGGAEEAVTLQRQWRVPRHAPAVAEVLTPLYVKTLLQAAWMIS